MKPLHRVSLAATAMALATAISYSAFACKSDYCAGSQAPLTLGQVGGTQNYQSPPPPPPPQTCVPIPTGQFSTDYSNAQNAITAMTGSTIYAFMTSFATPAEQYIFYTNTVGLNSSLQATVLSSMFGGNQTTMNTWLNNEANSDPGASGGSFDLLTGTVTYNPGAGNVSAAAPNWVCP